MKEFAKYRAGRQKAIKDLLKRMPEEIKMEATLFYMVTNLETLTLHMSKSLDRARVKPSPLMMGLSIINGILREEIEKDPEFRALEELVNQLSEEALEDLGP